MTLYDISFFIYGIRICNNRKLKKQENEMPIKLKSDSHPPKNFFYLFQPFNQAVTS